MLVAVLIAVLLTVALAVATGRHCRPQLRDALGVLEDARSSSPRCGRHEPDRH